MMPLAQSLRRANVNVGLDRDGAAAPGLSRSRIGILHTQAHLAEFALKHNTDVMTHVKYTWKKINSLSTCNVMFSRSVMERLHRTSVWSPVNHTD